jgi:hypothetical protein
MPRIAAATTFVLAALLFAGKAQAHFPWLTVSNEGKAVYFFGESLADQTYHLPPSLTKATVSLTADEASRLLEMDAIETDHLVGMTSVANVPKDAVLTSAVTYGIYHGARLDYCTQHLGGQLPSNRRACRDLSDQLDLYAQIIDTPSGIDVYVIWHGQALEGAKVQLYCQDGHEEGSATTDADGKVSFTDKQVESGLNGILVGHKTEDQAGELNGQAYESVSHYLTATFFDPQDFEDRPTKAKISVTADRYPTISEGVTSFGGAVANDFLYLYGGHTGRAHEYYSEAQANTLWRLDLNNPKSWESMGDGPGLQGLAMVACAGKLYRIGGFTAKNQDGQDQDLWSQAAVACFNPTSGQWTDLPSLPEPRSSFDAAVMDNKIYVVGGWTMHGGQTTWLNTAHVLDLSQEPLKWQTLPAPPFERRALSVAAYDGKVYAIGGMQRVGGPTTRVDVFDVASQTWSRGPDLQGEGMDGFGSSAFAIGTGLFVTTYSGSLQRLAGDGKSWQPLTVLERDRFFHRLLPLSNNELLVIGGASMSAGKFTEVEVIRIE